MDLTYYAAGALSIVIGFVGALFLVGMKSRSYWRFALITLVASVFADCVLLVDWSHANEMTAVLLLTDAAFFTAYGLVGCAIGALPVVAAHGIFQLVTARLTK